MTAETEAPRRGRPIDPYVDEALRTATIEIISKAGWRGATIERIAERAGVARTTIYRRHGSVHGVLLLLMEDIYSGATTPDTGALRTDLVEMLTATARTWRDPAFVDFLCAMVAAQREDSALQTAYRAQFQVRRAAVSAIITRAEERGELRPGADGTMLLDLLNGWFVQRALVYDAGLEDYDIVRMVDTLLLAFTVPQAAGQE